MKKRIREKKEYNRRKKLEKEAISKLRERYRVRVVKKGTRKNDVIISGLENWKIQFEYYGDKASILMHPYTIIDSFKYTDVYISMVDIDDNVFGVLDDIIENEKYHIGCAWGGISNSQEEGLKKYNDYILDYKKHSDEVKNVKLYMDSYLEEISKDIRVKEIILCRHSDRYEERFGVFVFANVMPGQEYDEFYGKIEKGFKRNKYQPRGEVGSRSLLPGRGVKYRFSGLFIGKDEKEYRRRIGTDIYKSLKK